MDKYNLRRPRINRELTEEERQELDGLLNYNSDDSDIYSGEGSEYEPESDNETLYDEGDEITTLYDVEFEELIKSIEIDANELDDEPGQSGDDANTAVQPNRGQNYVGQGKGDETVW